MSICVYGTILMYSSLSIITHIKLRKIYCNLDCVWQCLKLKPGLCIDEVYTNPFLYSKSWSNLFNGWHVSLRTSCTSGCTCMCIIFRNSFSCATIVVSTHIRTQAGVHMIDGWRINLSINALKLALTHYTCCKWRKYQKWKCYCMPYT